MTARFAVGAVQASGEMASEPRMDVRHVVDAVRYVAGLPLDANVPFLTVMATRDALHRPGLSQRCDISIR